MPVDVLTPLPSTDDEILVPRPSRWLGGLVLAGLWRTGDIEPERRGRRSRFDAPLLIMLALTALWCVVFGYLLWIRHARFATFDFDLAIHDQAVWLMTHKGHGFLTVRGLPALGHHTTFNYWLFAPFYWLGAGPQFLNLFQVVSLAAPAVVLFLLGRDRMGSGWQALPFGIAWLCHPSLQFLAWETFHPEAVALVWLVLAYLMASRGQWRWFWVFVVVALCWKEDIGLAVMMLGLILVLWRHRRRGVLVMGLGFAWFVLMSNVLMPALTGHGTHAGTFYGDLGNSTTEIAINGIKHPGEVIQRFDDNNADVYARKIAEPFGFTSILSPVNLLMGLPQFTISMLSVAYFVVDPRYHYVSIPLLAAGIAMVEGVSRLRPRHLRTGLGVLIVGCAVMATVTSGLSPIGDQYRKGYWPLVDDGRNDSRRAAVAIPGKSDSVSTTWNITPHMSHRVKIYTFPNPWRTVNWGIHGEDPDDPAGVEWLVLDLPKIGEKDRAIYDDLVSSGEFTVVFDQDQVVVAHRARPPTPPASG